MKGMCPHDPQAVKKKSNGIRPSVGFFIQKIQPKSTSTSTSTSNFGSGMFRFNSFRKVVPDKKYIYIFTPAPAERMNNNNNNNNHHRNPRIPLPRTLNLPLKEHRKKKRERQTERHRIGITSHRIARPQSTGRKNSEEHAQGNPHQRTLQTRTTAAAAMTKEIKARMGNHINSRWEPNTRKHRNLPPPQQWLLWRRFLPFPHRRMSDPVLLALPCPLSALEKSSRERKVREVDE